jgi:hypothetical protein
MDLCRLTRLNSQLKRGPEKSGMFSQQLAQSIRHPGLRVLKTPPQRPHAQAICARWLGTLQRECLDFVIS